MLQLEIPVMNFEPPCRDVEGRLLLTPTTTPYSLSSLFSVLFRTRGYRHALGRLVTTFLVKKQVILFELTVFFAVVQSYSSVSSSVWHRRTEKLWRELFFGCQHAKTGESRSLRSHFASSDDR